MCNVAAVSDGLGCTVGGHVMCGIVMLTLASAFCNPGDDPQAGLPHQVKHGGRVAEAGLREALGRVGCTDFGGQLHQQGTALLSIETSAQTMLYLYIKESVYEFIHI